MNCSMNIFVYFYFSNDFPSIQWFNFFVVDLVLTWEVLKGLRVEPEIVFDLK